MNGESMIVGCLSWVIWGMTGYTQSGTKY
jgi:hypothetical protein